MTGHSITRSGTGRASSACRAGAAILIAVSFAAIMVHGKASRAPKPVLAETMETVRAADRPQTH